MISQLRKYRIRAMLLREKRTVGSDLDTVLDGLRYDPEEAEYVKSMWDQI